MHDSYHGRTLLGHSFTMMNRANPKDNRAYGLTRDELSYILDPADVKGPEYSSKTFRVLKEKEIRQRGEYRNRRLVLGSWGWMEAGGEFAAMGM